MKQLTIRGFEPALERKLHEMAQREGISLNQAALRLMRRGAGLKSAEMQTPVIGDALDHLVGTWSEQDESAFLKSISICESVDHDLWH